jgi:DNA-binding NarL/FixJ family response regulator
MTQVPDRARPMDEVEDALAPSDVLRVVLVEDHRMVREVLALACLTCPGIEVVGEAENGFAAIEAILRLRPDVVLLDLSLPLLDGFQVLARLRGEPTPPKVLVVSGTEEPSAILECFRLGADGFVQKSAAADDVVAALRAVADGNNAFGLGTRRIARLELRERARRAREARRVSEELSPREREVLVLITEGLSTRRTAHHLGISERTVEAHIRSLYRKLGVRTRVQALYRATQLGLVLPAKDGDTLRRLDGPAATGTAP